MKKIVSIGMLTIVGVLISTNQASAKDLYVATTGNDSVSYAANDIDHPWRSVAHAWATVASGDNVFYRAGTYNITTYHVGDTNKADHVTHSSYNNEDITWYSESREVVIEPNGDYITVDGITINWQARAVGGDRAFFGLGWPTGNSATHFTLQNTTATTNVAGDNTGIIIAKGALASHLLVQNCVLTGAGYDTGSKNASGIMTFRLPFFTYRNNIISSFYNGFHENKHSNADGTGGIVENNYVYNCKYSMKANHVDTIVRNNIFTGRLFYGWDGGSGLASGSDKLGSDRNRFLHNTITGDIRWNHEDNDPPNENIHRNNLFTKKLLLWWEQAPPSTNTNSFDWNQYITGDCILEGPSTNYTLSEWRTHHGQDANSISANATFVGGPTPHTIAGYALASGSAGKGAASDGTDMGANVSLVGPGGGAGQDTTPPTLSEITPVSTPTTNPTPSYVFSSNEAGTITYGGDCSSATTLAVIGNNSVAFNTLADGTHNNCTITVTDSSNNTSTPLSVTTFTITSSSIRADVDQSGTVDTTDAFLTLRNSLGLDMLSTQWHASSTTGDVDCNSITDATDASLILRDSLGLEMGETGWCEM